MGELAGKTNIVYVLDGATPMSASTGDPVLGADNSSYNQLCDLLEITQFGDTHKSRLGGLKDTSVSVSGNYDPDDTTGQKVLEDNVGDVVHIGVYPQGTGEAGKQVEAYVESFELSAGVGDKQTFSCSLQGNDTPETLPAQSA